MPSPSATPATDPDAPNVRSVVGRYRRAERAASWTLALIAVGAFLAAVAALSFWPGAAVGAVLLVALRVPLFRRRGSTRLRTDATPEAVVREFATATPPILAFQWVVADEVRRDGATDPTDSVGEDASGADATYEFSYLFGLKTVELDLAVDVAEEDPLAGESGTDESESASDRPPVATVDIEGTAGGEPWGSYAVAVREAPDGGSVVDVELRPTRRFGLRRLPQGWAAERYYAEALAAQGYETVERTVSVTR
ncbi:hypothetical protein GLW36_02330 [Halorubrum terrestre]|uniref:Uncharacterized protein n=1 Tax=Halorubrum distributum TaxID=29283 RepID=A0A6B1IK88_9EURY|nr:hypothetical protein [Halorubrum terrestre]MYL15484.1 hypothetical protein [Halorubrum terrestre]